MRTMCNKHRVLFALSMLLVGLPLWDRLDSADCSKCMEFSKGTP